MRSSHQCANTTASHQQPQRALRPVTIVPQPQCGGMMWLITSPLHVAALSAAHGAELPRSREQVLLHQAVAEPGKTFFRSLPPQLSFHHHLVLISCCGMDSRECVGRIRPTIGEQAVPDVMMPKRGDGSHRGTADGQGFNIYRPLGVLEPRGTPFPRPSGAEVGKGLVHISHTPALQGTGCWGGQGRRGILPLQAAPSQAGPASQVAPSPLEQPGGTCHPLTGLRTVSLLLPSALGSAIQWQSLEPSHSAANKIFFIACKGRMNMFHAQKIQRFFSQ